MQTKTDRQVMQTLVLLIPHFYLLCKKPLVLTLIFLVHPKIRGQRCKIIPAQVPPPPITTTTADDETSVLLQLSHYY